MRSITIRQPSRRVRIVARKALAVAFGLTLGATLAYATVARSASLAALASLTLSPATVATGSVATGTVTLDGISAKVVTVSLSSGNTQLVTVPTSVTISSPKALSSFQVQTVSGAAGCTSVTARLLTDTKRATVFVLPPPSGAPVKLTVPESAFLGQTVTGRVVLINVPVGRHVVQLASNNTSAATVPATVTVDATQSEVGVIGAATFPIQTSVAGGGACAVISATRSGTTARGLLKLSPLPG